MGNFVNRDKKKKIEIKKEKDTPCRRIINGLKKDLEERRRAKWKAFQKDKTFNI